MIHPSEFNGLTPEQVRLTLARIASNVDLACDICRQECANHGLSEAANTFASLATLLEGVGVLADMPNTSPVVGGVAEWMLGPNFGATPGGRV